ncbi:MAG TPA: hypothetical protein VF819_03095 [Nitrospira sp.]
MPTPVYNIGVDLSKRFLDGFLLPDKSHFRLNNDSAGVSQLCDRARELLQNGEYSVVSDWKAGSY